MIIFLNERKRTTISELAEKFEVSRRTVMRDLDAISSLGVPVYTQPGFGGGVWIAENYRFDRSFFSEYEIEDLVLAMHIAEHLRGRSSRNSIIRKLEMLLPDLTYAKENDFLEYVKVEPLLKGSSFSNPVMVDINKALDDEVNIVISLSGSLHEIAPLYYHIGTSGISICGVENEELLSIPIDSISSTSLTEKEFNRADFSRFL